MSELNCPYCGRPGLTCFCAARRPGQTQPSGEVERLRARVAELEGLVDMTARAGAAEAKREFERAEKVEAEVARLRESEAGMRRLATLAFEAVERLSRLAEGKEGRKPQVALGWIRECSKDIRAPWALALSGTGPAPLSERERALVDEARRAREVIATVRQAWSEDLTRLDAALAAYAEVK